MEDPGKGIHRRERRERRGRRKGKHQMNSTTTCDEMLNSYPDYKTKMIGNRVVLF
jgi:hypothetical protein